MQNLVPISNAIVTTLADAYYMWLRFADTANCGPATTNGLKGVRISAYTNQSRVSHSVRMRENSAEEYPKQSSLERSF